MKTTLLKITTALAGAGALSAAQAVPLDWTVDVNLRLVSPFTLSTIGTGVLGGSFTYDADTGTLTNLNMQTTGDITRTVTVAAVTDEGLKVSNDAWGSLFLQQQNWDFFNPTPWATNAGGVVEMKDSSGRFADGQPLLRLDFSQTNTVSSVAAVTAVPEPQTVALMAAGLGVLGAAVRRRQRTPA